MARLSHYWTRGAVACRNQVKYDMTRLEIMYALDWMLEEAECYVGCVPTTDPHEAAERILTYWNDLRDNAPDRYNELIGRAKESAKHHANGYCEMEVALYDARNRSRQAGG